MVEAAKSSGRHVNVATHLVKILRSVGSIVKEEVRYVHIECWLRDLKLILLGQVVGEMLTGGPEGLSLRLFTRDLGWTKEEALIFPGESWQEYPGPQCKGIFQSVRGTSALWSIDTN